MSDFSDNDKGGVEEKKEGGDATKIMIIMGSVSHVCAHLVFHLQ